MMIFFWWAIGCVISFCQANNFNQIQSRYKLPKHFTLSPSEQFDDSSLRLDVRVDASEQSLSMNCENHKVESDGILDFTSNITVQGNLESLSLCMDSIVLYSYAAKEESLNEGVMDPSLTYLLTDNKTFENRTLSWQKIELEYVDESLPIVKSIHPSTGYFKTETNVSMTLEDETLTKDCNNFICIFVQKDFEIKIPIGAVVDDNCTMVVCSVPPLMQSPDENTQYVRIGLSNGIDEGNFFTFRYKQIENIFTTKSNSIDDEGIVSQGFDIASLVPDSGPVSGASSILVIGRGFFDDPRITCKFGNDLVQGRWITSSKIECMSPPQSKEDILSVSVGIGEDHRYFESNLQFQYKNDILVEGIFPSVSSVVGGVNVTILVNQGLGSDDDFICRFGFFHQTIGTFLNSSALSCASPPGLSGTTMNVAVSRNGGHDFSDSTRSLQYYSNPVIYSLNPPSGYADRENLVKISVSLSQQFELPDHLRRCVVKDELIIPVYQSPEEIHCIIPLALGEKSVDISISLDEDGIIRSAARTFAFLEPFRITSISPSTSPTSGGSSILLFGENIFFQESSSCMFGDKMVKAYYVGTDKVSCKTPQYHVGQVPLYFSHDGDNFTFTGFFIDYYDVSDESDFHTDLDHTFEEQSNPIVLNTYVSNIDDQSLSIGVIGENFRQSENLICNFGSKQAQVLWISSFQIECFVAISWYPQIASIAVSNNGLDFVYENVEFGTSRLTVEKVYHNITSGFIVASGFSIDVDEKFTCLINNQSALIKVISTNELHCSFTAYREVDQVVLKLCANGACSEDYNVTITQMIYVEDPIPLNGPIAGGTEVRFGLERNVTSRSKCRFGTKHVSIQKLNMDTYYCKAPSVSSPNTVNFDVSFDGINFVDSLFQFTYWENITLYKLKPQRIRNGSDQRGIQILGSKFEEQLPIYCHFNEDMTTKGIRQSSSQVWCSLPNLPPGKVKVSLSFDNQTMFDESLTLTIVPRIELQSIYPHSGPAGTQVEICASYIPLGEQYFCIFGADQVSGLLSRHNCLQCVAPSRSIGRVDKIAIKSNSQGRIESSLNFTYQSIVLESISPVILQKNTKQFELNVKGSGFEYLPLDSFCRIGDNFSKTLKIDSTKRLVCFFTDFDQNENTTFGIENRFMSLMAKDISIDIVDAPELVSIHPAWMVHGSLQNIIEVKGRNIGSPLFHCVIGNISSTSAIITSKDSALCFFDSCSFESSMLRVTNDGVTLSRGFQDVECRAPMTASLVTPKSGLLGSTVNITGTNFKHGVQCVFGSDVVQADLISSNLIICRLPQFTNRLWKDQINIIQDGRNVSVADNHLDFNMVDLQVASISPTFASVSGGTNITITLDKGTSSQVSHCIFNNVYVNATAASVDDKTIFCVTPQSNTSGTVRLALSSNGHDATITSSPFEYIEDMIIHTITPELVSELGDTTVEVHGENFPRVDGLRCLIGNISVDARWLSNELVECDVPQMMPGDYDFKTLYGKSQLIESADSGQEIKVFPAIRLKSILPSMGWKSDDSRVLIKGTNFFNSSKLTCKFDVSHTMAIFQSRHIIECLAPRQLSSTSVNFSLAVNGRSVSNSLSYSHIEEPIIESVQPLFLSIEGGTLRVITRTPLYRNEDESLETVECFIGTIRQEAIYMNTTAVECQYPQGKKGATVSLSIKYSDGYVIWKQEKMEYVEPFIVKKVHILDEYKKFFMVLIHGENFERALDQGLFCRHDGDLSFHDVSRISSTNLMCKVPKFEITDNSVIEIWTSKDSAPTHRMDVSTKDIVSLRSLSPNIGITGNYHNLTVYGNGFLSFENMACSFDSHMIVPANVITSSILSCLVPANSKSRDVRVEILVYDSVKLSSERPLYFSIVDLQVASISPTFASISGGTNITITLDKGTSSQVSHCIFNNVYVNATAASVDDKTIFCVTPQSNTSGTVRLALSSNGHDATITSSPFEYIEDMIIHTITPELVSELGDTTVEVHGENFPRVDGLRCLIGNVSVNARWLSSELVECDVPQMMPGDYVFGIASLFQKSFLNSHLKLHPAFQLRGSSINERNGVLFLDFEISQKRDFSDAFCLFRDISSPVILHNGNLSCQLPQMLIQQDIDLVQSYFIFNDATVSRSLMIETPIPPIITGISPRKARSLSKVTIRILGNFEKFVANNNAELGMCRFNGVIAALSIENERAVTCPMVLKEGSGVVPVAVTFDGGLIWSNPIDLQILEPLKISLLEPIRLSTQEGGSATLNLANCVQDEPLSCFVGTKSEPRSVTWMGVCQVKCTLPPHYPGPSTMFITNGKKEDIVASAPIYYHDEPRIYNFIPQTVPMSGGTVVEILGMDLDILLEPKCHFGSIVVNGTIVSRDRFRCSSPKVQRPQISSFSVSDSTAFSWVSKKGFQFMKPMVVITNEYDYSRQGFVLKGSHLNNTRSLWCRSKKKNGEHEHPLLVLNLTSTSGFCPSSVPLDMQGDEITHLEISSDNHHWIKVKPPFFKEIVEITSIYPLEGASSGGTNVVFEISEVESIPVFHCEFGSVLVEAEQKTSDSFICTSPKFRKESSETIVPLTIHSSLPLAGVTRYSFQYRDPCRLIHINPIFLHGGDSMTIHGFNFRSGVDYFCSFGFVDVKGEVINTSTLRCDSPLFMEGDARFSVRSEFHEECHHDSPELYSNIHFAPKVSIGTVRPSIVVQNTTKNLTIFGNGFQSEYQKFCMIGTQQIAATVVSNSELCCHFPLSFWRGKTSFSLGISGSLNQVDVNIIDQAVIHSLFPDRLAFNHPTKLEVTGAKFVRTGQIFCAFGIKKHLYPARWISSERVLCDAPMMNDLATESFPIPVSLTLNSGNDFTNELNIKRKNEMRLISPKEMIGFPYIRHKIEVQVDGLNDFGSVYHCDVQGVVTIAEIQDKRTVRCLLPTLTIGDYEVYLVQDYTDRILIGSLSLQKMPLIQSITPDHVYKEATAEIRILGSNLENIHYCVFDGINEHHVKAASYIDNTTIFCESPWSRNNEMYQVGLSSDGHNIAQTNRVFRIVDKPIAFVIEPSKIFGDSNYTVNVHGMNFVNTKDLVCKIDSVLTEAAFVTPIHMKCFPGMLRPGYKTLSISTNGIHFVKVRNKIHVRPLVEIINVHPNFSSVSGGELVTVTLSNDFEHSKTLKCHFGSESVPAIYYERNKVACRSASLAFESWTKLKVSMDGIFLHKEIPFKFVTPPIITSLQPREGKLEGGDLLRVDLVELDLDLGHELICLFSPKQVVKPIFVGMSYVECLSPPSLFPTQNSVSVSVHYSVSEYTLYDGPEFTYIKLPALHSIVPSFGPINGGTTLVISGNSFPEQVDFLCLFNGISTVAVVVNENEIRCTSPRVQRHGKVLVELSSIDGTLQTSNSSIYFDFLPLPTINNFFPIEGSFWGGTKVKLFGSGFQTKYPGSLRCKFGDGTSPAKYVNENEIVCKTPSLNGRENLGENVTVGLTLNGVDFHVTSQKYFKYVGDNRIIAITPTAGPLSGGTRTSITILSTYNIESSRQVECHFGNVSVPALGVTTLGQLWNVQCLTPAKTIQVSGPVSVDFSINDGNDKTTSTIMYHYRPNPIVASVRPSYGFISGAVRTLWVSTEELHCTTPKLRHEYNASLSVSMSKITALTDQFGSISYSFRNMPIFDAINLNTLHADGRDELIIQGQNLEKAQYCRLGIFGREVPVLTANETQVVCRMLYHPSDLIQYQRNLGLFISFQGDFVPTNFILSYKFPDYSESFDQMPIRPILSSIEPQFTNSFGREWITVRGANFSNLPGLFCLFDGIKQEAIFISRTEIKCLTPVLAPGLHNVHVVNSFTANSTSSQRLRINFDTTISSIYPSFGPMDGGTSVNVNGRFAMNNQTSQIVTCHFGNEESPGVLLSSTAIQCVSPPYYKEVAVTLSISFGTNPRSESSILFSYRRQLLVTSIKPSNGNLKGGTRIIVQGQYFEETDQLSCRFGLNTIVDAFYISSTSLLCLSPSTNSLGPVDVHVSSNGLDFSPSSIPFTYTEIQILSISPSFTLLSTVDEDSDISILTTTKLQGQSYFCLFSSMMVRASVSDEATLKCRIPKYLHGSINIRIGTGSSDHDVHVSNSVEYNILPHPQILKVVLKRREMSRNLDLFIFGNNFHRTNLYKCEVNGMRVEGIFINSKVITCLLPLLRYEGTLQIRVSPNGQQFYLMDYVEISDILVASTNLLMAPNGTFASNHHLSNFSLCDPGSFAPREGLSRCFLCPIGYFCPDFGTIKPKICTPGKVCDSLGLVNPITSCPKGHYCLEGTKSKMSSSLLHSSDWIVDKKTGVATIRRGESEFEIYNRSLPESGMFTIEHFPGKVVQAEQPIVCSIGFYCLEGVSSPFSRVGDFSTPQPCFDGYFCPRGSWSPQGSGPCKSGFFCPSDRTAVECPIGHFCPGVANVKPTPCLPGTFANATGMAVCHLCEVGHICPNSTMTTPVLCPEGYICDSKGLSIPDKPCTPGFICHIGTSTSDDQSTVLSKPYPCPSGTFCLGGVAHNITNDWHPNHDQGKYSPQACLEGYYCEEGSSFPTAPCFPGHYCPPGSSQPEPNPVGTYSEEGAIVPILCPPNTYAPNIGSSECSPCPAGYSCREYGTSIPSICNQGSYRGAADSVACKPCPPATYLPYKGASDISECLPVLSGRVSVKKGVQNLTKTTTCDGSYICSLGTQGFNQYDHKCASGHFCDLETSPLDEFNNLCERGYHCKRGTSEKLKKQEICLNGEFCPDGSSISSAKQNLCPRQSSSKPGSGFLLNCSIQKVDICDKTQVNNLNPGEDNFYYDEKLLSIADSTSTGRKSEVMALKKIVPYEAPSTLKWRNETVEVFRTCPTIAISRNISSWIQEDITLIGRNFHRSSSLKCRFRVMGTEGINNDTEASFSVTTAATFISTTRIKCTMPDLDQVEMLIEAHGKQNPSCIAHYDGNVYFKGSCNHDSDDNCVGSYFRNDRHVRHFSILIPCTDEEISSEQCENDPFDGFYVNPCYSASFVLDASNDGTKFSGDEIFIPFTADTSIAKLNNFRHFVIPSTTAKIKFVKPTSFQTKADSGMLLQALLNIHQSKCSKKIWKEEGIMSRENDWIRLPFMNQAQITLDWTKIPAHFRYNEHFTLSLFASPSRCDEFICTDDDKTHSLTEMMPCSKPIRLPSWFTSSNVNKHQHLNLTMIALDDVIFKIEVHILDGMYLPLTNLFRNTVNITSTRPRRDKADNNFRKLSPYISWEERKIPMEYFFGVRLDNSKVISPPMNLPPRWKDFERGRVLVSMNSTVDNPSPSIKDRQASSLESSSFWENPFSNTYEAKEATDAFAETFHGLFVQTSDGSYEYDLQSLLLPYLPFFSNCREFDSYIPLTHAIASDDCQLPGIEKLHPIDWWRRRYGPLPHPDDIKPIGPLDIGQFYPLADWCERKLYCDYEEDLHVQDVTPRWFEAPSGTSLFSIIRDPINYAQYTGRNSTKSSVDDSGGQKYIQSIDLFDTFIPVKVNRVEDRSDCRSNCIPRKLTLDISYYQMTKKAKRLVAINLFLDDFDTDVQTSRYEMDLRFYPLNYQELIVKFAFTKEIFILLFSLIGLSTVALSVFYWLVVRLTTRIDIPPKLKFWSTLHLIFPQALSGFSIGLIPIVFLTAFAVFIVQDYRTFPMNFIPIFETTRLHYMDKSINPHLLEATKKGRLGLSLLGISIILLFEGSKMFVPRRNSKREKEIELSRFKDAKKTLIWDSIQWRRSNLILCSILMGILLVIIVEWSYWSSFGTYIWEAIIFLKILNIVLGMAVDRQTNELLLSTPIMTAMSLIEVIVTLSAVDFVDFLLSYVVGFGFLILERLYISPYQDSVLDWIAFKFSMCLKLSKSLLAKYGLFEDIKETNGDEHESQEMEGTVEPIIGSFGGYCSETLTLLYVPFVICLLMLFRDDLEMPERYGIKEQDMEYYALFALMIIPFQIASDVFLQSALELFHGWKIYDYLVYTRYRFLQRETKWKGFEDSLDECISDSVRTMDHMCFSSQFYMMMTIHVNGILYLVLGIQMISRARHNLFGDPATPLIIGVLVLTTAILKKILISVSLFLGIWRIRHENTAWHAGINDTGAVKLPDWDNIKGASHEAFEMNKRISSDSFRHKFLNYNRSWLIEQLPSILTPRTVRRSKPFLTNQVARVIQSLNGDISSDSESEDEPNIFVDTVSMSPEANTLLKDWHASAKRRLKLKESVLDLIERGKGSHCFKCSSKKSLKVQTLLSLEEMDARFKDSGSNAEVDIALWKQFWFKTMKYQTICLNCLSKTNEEEDVRPKYDAVELQRTSTDVRMLKSWLAGARSNLGKAIDVSDDDSNESLYDEFSWKKEKISLNPNSELMLLKWLRTARTRV
ncbi:hypothetical protein CTEN210_17444 [Chaetoceros tenuissimus]|uniref:IPT/TIG domain-containing protein n=1 Tax=Chaetoceros tenuissimus TaxID=426638 RepID=A0AAD3DAR3_9STRA|nr:hypothetical protein CTEN210_17444 [Chaetoceros tenuissimus]